MVYVDGFVIPIKKSKLKAYKKMAQLGKKTWMKYGALDYKECAGDDYRVLGGKTFLKLAGARPGEAVILAFITYKSRAHRDRVNAKVYKEFAASSPEEQAMPFDMKRMAFGGFKAFVS